MCPAGQGRRCTCASGPTGRSWSASAPRRRSPPIRGCTTPAPCWLDSLYLAVSHSGVTLAPVLGRLIAREVATKAADGLLASFRPARFAERATRVMFEVESIFRDPTRQNRST